MMRQAHQHQVLAANDVGWIGAVEVGGVGHARHRTLALGGDRLPARKLKSVGTKHAAEAGIAFCRIEHIGEGEEHIVLASADTVMMPVMRISAGGNRRALRHRCSRMR